MEFFYNFKEGKIVNPLDKVSHFYVNPRIIDSWKTLELGDKLAEGDDIVVKIIGGLPVIILPISLLTLNVVHIKVNVDGGMIITTDVRAGGIVTLKIYAKPTEDATVIRVDSVLCTSVRF